MANNSSPLGKLLTWVVAIVLAVVAFKITLAAMGAVMAAIGTMLGIVLFVLFQVVPLLIAGWVLWKVVQHFRRKDDFEPA